MRPTAITSPWLLAALSAALYFASFPPVDAGTVAFVAIVPLLLALRRASRRRAFLLAWFAGTVLSTSLVSASIYEAAARYFGDRGIVLLLFALIIPQIYGALYFALFGLLACGWERRSAAAALVLVPAAWTACEFARASIGFGTPWCLLGHSQHERLWLIQVADLGGVFAATFVVAAVNTFVALILAKPWGPRRGTALAAAMTAALLAIVWSYGARQLARWQRPAGVPLRVALVQPNLETRRRASLSELPSNLRRLLELSARVQDDGISGPPIDLIVWPENAVGFSMAANGALLRRATEALPPGGRLLLGAPREIEAAGKVVFRNSAFLLDRAGEIVGTYDKRRLTPFAETSPWSRLPLLRRRFAAGDVYIPGDRYVLLDVKGSRFGVLICYEAIYPDLTRPLVLGGAKFLVNISNDDWFAERAALTQHLDAALFRAVESRRFLLRATNSGVTAVIDPRGAVIASARPAEAAALTAAIVPIEERTVYSLTGDAFAWGCVLMAAISLLAPRREP